ncbi:MAG TPA: hypothetical protein VFN35_21920 [Ktedonobacteraceae bacterium]|nr:hypothetical protein [Ktedonobacteraceae bacterium]
MDNIHSELLASMIEERSPELPASISEEQPQQYPISYTDIILYCHPNKAREIAQAFELEITHASGALPMIVRSVSLSLKRHQGVIVLEWEGTVTDHFLHNLAIDEDIIDYSLYTWTISEDS